jgi:hypothetical protein
MLFEDLVFVVGVFNTFKDDKMYPYGKEKSQALLQF